MIFHVNVYCMLSHCVFLVGQSRFDPDPKPQLFTREQIGIYVNCIPLAEKSHMISSMVDLVVIA